MITIIAKFNIKSGCTDSFRRAALDCVRETRKEKGNLAYKIYRGRKEENEFTFLEEWLNDTAIEAHNNAPHFIKFLDAIKPLCETAPEINQIIAVPSVY